MPRSRASLRSGPHRHPWEYNPLDKSQAAAVQANMRGEATPDQQKLAMEVIVVKLSERGEMTYRQDASGMAFAEGRRFVGNLIVEITRTPLSEFQEVNR